MVSYSPKQNIFDQWSLVILLVQQGNYLLVYVLPFQCSDKPQVISYYMSHEEHLWVVIDDMVEIFDPQRKGFFKHHNCFVWMNKYCSGVELVVDG